MKGTSLSGLSPAALRAAAARGEFRGQTSGLCPGYAQANLVVLPAKYAYDFLLFAQRNPQACPLLEVTDTGARRLRKIAPGADIAKEIPEYRIYENGILVSETDDVSGIWREDFVSFLIGCSFSFEEDLLEAGIPVRNIEEGKNVPMYLTDIPCEPAGIFHGNLVVSMRPMSGRDAVRAACVTAGMPRVHGAPVRIGEPEKIGIRDLSKPDFGEAVTVRPGEVPVFWACGVTPQAAVMASKPEIAVTHAPGHMLITDIRNAALRG